MSWCQYDAHPTNFDEFIEAIASSDTRVICPEDAVWDANDFCPQGYSNQAWNINCDQILGQGLTIKNLKLIESYFVLRSSGSGTNARLDAWDSINLTNMVVHNINAQYLFKGGSRVSSIDGQTIPSDQRHVRCVNSAFSGMISSNIGGGGEFTVFGAMAMDTCACNLEVVNSNATTGRTQVDLGWSFELCNMKVATQRIKCMSMSSTNTRFSRYSWFDIYGDDVSTLEITYKSNASIFRCSCPIADVKKADSGYPSVVSVPDPLTVVLPADSNLIVCTDAQCRDANWLHDAGFPIAVDP